MFGHLLHHHTPPLCTAMLSSRATCSSLQITCGTGLQRLMESYTRLQQLRGLPATVPPNAAASLQQTSKVRDGSCFSMFAQTIS